jgi:hypothetical protein
MLPRIFVKREKKIGPHDGHGVSRRKKRGAPGPKRGPDKPPRPEEDERNFFTTEAQAF